jgi:hypothetical protein
LTFALAWEHEFRKWSIRRQENLIHDKNEGAKAVSALPNKLIDGGKTIKTGVIASIFFLYLKWKTHASSRCKIKQ